MLPRRAPARAVIAIAVAGGAAGCGRAGFDERVAGGPEVDVSGLQLVTAEEAPSVLRLRGAADAWATAVDLERLAGRVDQLVARRAGDGSLVVAYQASDPAGLYVRRIASRLEPPLALDAGAPPRHRRGFDVAVEASSGAALVVYADGTPAPKWRRLAGGAWSAPGDVSEGLPPTTGVPAWVTLAAHPTTDEIALVYATDQRELHVRIWDGAAWSAPPAGAPAPAADPLLDPITTLTSIDYPCFGAAYEQQRGRLLVVWSADDRLAWRVRPPGGPLTAPGEFNPNGQPGPLTLAAEPGTDRIAVIVAEREWGIDNDLSALIWSDGAWIETRPAAGGTDWIDANISPYEAEVGAAPGHVSWLEPGRASFLYADVGATAAFEWSAADRFTAPRPVDGDIGLWFSSAPAAAADVRGLAVGATAGRALVPLRLGADGWSRAGAPALGTASELSAFALVP